MDLLEDSSRCESFRATTSMNMSTSSSVFLSANQSPFFSPRSPSCQSSEPTSSCSGFQRFDHIPSTSSGVPKGIRCSGFQRCCDVFIGLHGRKASLLRFANWLKAELEVQGISCFLSDRARCRSSHKLGAVWRAMEVSSFGVVILTRKSFKNPFTIQELHFFSSKKNLVPIFFDVGPADCIPRDIVEKKGELWGNHGGELWVLYGGSEKEWKEAVHGLSRVDEFKLEAQHGNWRDCMLRTVTLLGIKLGRRSIVERLTKWREKVEKDEFPFHRNQNFIGRKKELSELEFILFGDVSGDSKRDYFDLKAKPRRKDMTFRRKERQPDGGGGGGSRKGKEKLVWKESENDIEMQSNDQHQLRQKNGGRKKRSTKIMYGKGVACVSGESGIGKTELLLEFAYKHHQRYKMVLWIGGENRYIRQNYMNLRSSLFSEADIEFHKKNNRTQSFEEQEQAAIFQIRKQLMRNIPYLVVIDNLENEKDWWDHKPVMDLLPRFGGETHIIISTRLPRVMNLEPLKLSYLSGIEARFLMQGGVGKNKDYPIPEIDALRMIEERLGRLTLGLAIVGAILTELPINPSRLLDTISRTPLRDGKEGHALRKKTFLLQLLEVCFSIFDHADGLATRMIQASGWFAPAAIPVSLLALAAHEIPEKTRKRTRTESWRRLLRSLSCGRLRLRSEAEAKAKTKREVEEATSMLLRFNIARNSNNQGLQLHIHDVIKLYARNHEEASHAMVQAIISHAPLVCQHSEHVWAACFMVFGFGNHRTSVIRHVVSLSELLYFVNQLVLPLATRTFVTFSRCAVALELLRLCTDALETADQAFVVPVVENCLDKSVCWRSSSVQTTAQLNPWVWRELALSRATLLETRAKLVIRGGKFDVGDDLIRRAIFIRTSICGEDHPDTVSSFETLSKITRLRANC